MIKMGFTYTDEHGQESTLNKTFDDSVLEIQDTFELLVDNFKTFLLATGFDSKLVDKIEINY